MWFNFSKSKKLGQFRVSVSKSGISTGVGVKGYSVTRKANGKIQSTASIPGTGLRYTSQLGKNKSYNNIQENSIMHSRKYYKTLYILANITSGILAILSLPLLIVALPIGIILAAITVFIFFMGKTGKKIYLNYDELSE